MVKLVFPIFFHCNSYQRKIKYYCWFLFSKPSFKSLSYDVLFYLCHIKIPQRIFYIPQPWERENLERNTMMHKIEVFKCYSGSILNPFGINPEYPFAQIFIAQTQSVPGLLLWVMWYPCHQNHIPMEFQCPFFSQFSNLAQNLQFVLTMVQTKTMVGNFVFQQQWIYDNPFSQISPCEKQRNTGTTL